jgi:trimethylamine--corrinoid protein Co-methyltransferase
MRTKLSVLSNQELDRIHESSLTVLADVGVRVESAQARQLLEQAGAAVDHTSGLVKFPRDFVEKCLKLVPKQFTLGARRPGWDLPLNQGQPTLLIGDGEATGIMDYPHRKIRKPAFKDWRNATRLMDSIDEIGVYWALVEGYLDDGSLASHIKYWKTLFNNFSKHVQDPISKASHAPWFFEVLQVVFGDKEKIIAEHPVSFLVCPQSPLILDEQYTEALLALTGWKVPTAVMPMPLMGSTSPGTMVSLLITGNCEVLAMLCLLQAADPGWPVIYAPALAASNPRNGLYRAGGIENGVLSVASIEVARYYNLPVEASGGGSDHFFPGNQAGYERGITAMLTRIANPDLMVGPGILGGSTVMSLEQLLIDVEIFRMSQHAARGVDTSEQRWLMEDIAQVGPGGHFLSSRSTAKAIRDGEWFHPKLGMHTTLESWQENGSPLLIEEAHRKVEELLKQHTPIPLPAEALKELDKIEKRAKLEDEKVV